MKCPNCAAILPLKLVSPGTVQCEYCGDFIAVGAIPLYDSSSNAECHAEGYITQATEGCSHSEGWRAQADKKEVTLLQVTDSTELIAEAIKNTGITFKQAADAMSDFAKIMRSQNLNFL